jgi:MFS family permease
MTFGQLGVVDAFAFAFGLIMEVPTGAISDLIGKKKTLLASSLLGSIGVMLISSSNGIWQIFIGFLIAQAGWAFYSGAAEAMAYDSLKEAKKADRFDKVISTSTIIGIIATAVTTLMGIAMYNYNFRFPHYAWGFAYLVGFFACFFLTEPKIDSVKFSFKNYFHQMFQGAKELTVPTLRPYLFIMFMLLGIYYLYSYGLVKPAIEISFGFFATQQGFIQALLGVICAIAVSFVPKFRGKFSDVAGLLILATTMAIGFFLAALPLGYWGFFVILAISVAGNLASPWVSIVVNRELPSKYRATALSTISLFTKIPYVIAAIVAGKMIDGGILWLFNVAIGVLMTASVIWTLYHFYSKGKLSWGKNL